VSNWLRRACPARVRPAPPAARRPRVEPLEDRSTPTALYGLTTAGGLVTFDSLAPGTVSSPITITGLQTGETLLGLDARPSTGQLYGIGSTSRVYVIDTTSGAATPVGTGPFTPALSGTNVGFDFNPVADKLRVVTDAGQDLRIDPATGAVAATDPTLAYDPATFDAVIGGTPPAPQVVAEAYTKNVNPATGAPTTTLYGIDPNLDVLVTQGGPGDDPTSPSPNTGTLFVVDKLGFDAGPDTSFDIEAGTDKAFAVTGNKLYSVNLSTGVGSLLGTVGVPGLTGLAVAVPTAGAGTVKLEASALTFPANRGPLGVTITRTGGGQAAATVDFATADGTGVAGVDYLPANGTVTFNPGQASQVIFLGVPAGPSASTQAKTFSLALSNPSAGLTLGSPATVAINVPGVNPPAVGSSGKLFAVGGGPGAEPRVRVYDQATGKEVFNFLAFDQTFGGGVGVAVGDVNGDGVDDVVTGAGSGGGPRVRVVDGATQQTIADFFPYEANFRGGVNVAAGDVNGDGHADIVIGTGDGGGPRVQVFDGGSLSATNQTLVANFFAFEANFRGGVTVAAGDVTGDGNEDVIAGTGVGGGPRIQVFDGATLAAGPAAPPAVRNFFAYDANFRSGVLVAAGDVNGDGATDIVTGSGPGGGPNVRAFDGRNLSQVVNFFAYPDSTRGGVRVAAADLNGSGSEQIITAPGPGSAPAEVRAFANGTQTFSFQPFDAGFAGGLFVG
jgi:hypothetical protein